jgi:RNA polymerase sigma-70 factor (ECF subfamily)
MVDASDAMTDREVLVRSRTQPELFLHLFERRYDEIARYLARRLPRDTASDLASEVFAQAFASRGRFDASRGEPIAFLYGIAANLIRRQRRAEERMLRAYTRAAAEVGSAGSVEADDTASIAAVLLELRPEEREVLLLHAWADLDYEQIAAALGVAVGTVRSRLNRGRARLRSSLTGKLATTEEALDG